MTEEQRRELIYYNRHCGVKIKHEQKTQAEKHAKRLFERNLALGRSKNKSKTNVYRCCFCDNWHVGHRSYK